MKLNNEMNKIKKSVKSVRIKLFFTISIVITTIIIVLVLINNVVLEKYYLYNKTKVMKQTYKQINLFFNQDEYSYQDIEESLKAISIKNNVDILIRKDGEIIILLTDNYKNYANSEDEYFYSYRESGEDVQQLFKQNNLDIKLVNEKDTQVNYILVSAQLDNGYNLLMADFRTQ